MQNLAAPWNRCLHSSRGSPSIHLHEHLAVYSHPERGSFRKNFRSAGRRRRRHS